MQRVNTLLERVRIVRKGNQMFVGSDGESEDRIVLLEYKSKRYN